MAKIFQNFGSKVGNAFTNLGQGNSLLANQSQISNLSDEDRKKLQQQGLQKFADTMFLTSAIGSGDAQKIALAQNKIRQRQLDEEDAKRKADTETFLENNPQFRQAYELKNLLGIDMPTATDRKIVEGNDGFNYYADTGERVLPNVVAPIKSAGTMFQIVDGNNDNSFVGNISANDLATNGYKKYEEQGIDTTAFKLTALPTGTAPADTSGDTDFDALKGRFMATNTLINNLNGLGQQYFDNPESALAIGSASQFVDSIIQNVDAAGEMLSGKDYTTVKNKGYTTIEGNDFSDQLKKVSQATGVSESRVRDLAYLFAAARGQTGRGLSDKDYENALRIVSGGVGAEGKIKVLEDVANRLGSEVQGDLDFIVRNLPEGTNIDKYTKLRGSLPTFVNPYSINMQSITPGNNDAVINELLKKYGG